MELLSDKTMNCPFCLTIVSPQDYEKHVLNCRDVDFELLKNRLHTYCGISMKTNDDLDGRRRLLSEYLEFIRHDRSYYPAHWCDYHQTNNTDFYKVSLASREAKDLLANPVCTKSLKRIVRTQNKELYLRFLDFKMDNQGSDAMLFHGTRDENINLICNQGFDRGHSKNGLHGFGIYLSSTMSYSLAYAVTSDHRNLQGKSLMLCRTHLTTDVTISENIHVVHHDFAVYPEYILYI